MRPRGSRFLAFLRKRVSEPFTVLENLPCHPRLMRDAPTPHNTAHFSRTRSNKSLHSAALCVAWILRSRYLNNQW